MTPTLPADSELERLVLGSVLLDGSHMDTLRSQLADDDFSSEQHRRIWKRTCEVYDGGTPIDRLTVYAALQRAGDAEACDGLTYLIGLDDGLPQLPHLGAYVERLKDLALRRRLMLEGQRLMLRAQSFEEPLEDIMESLGKLEALTPRDKGGLVSTAEMIASEGLDRILGPRSSSSSISLPWPRLNGALSGLEPGQVILLMAATSRGKTSIALQCAVHAAIHGHTPLIWTMEMSPRSLFRRMVSQISCFPAGSFYMTFEERAKQRAAAAMLGDSPVWMDSQARTVAAFRASIRRTRAKFAVVDYLQLIRSTVKSGSRAQEVSDNSRQIKLTAMDAGIPILLLSQVDRGSVKGGGEIGLHSAKESGDVENDADVVMWIKAGELSRDRNTDVSVHIGKQREGPAGFDIPMLFYPLSQTFQEIQS